MSDTPRKPHRRLRQRLSTELDRRDDVRAYEFVDREENGEWNVVHHHADLHAEFAEMIANMGA